jgi:hypothetical protein
VTFDRLTLCWGDNRQAWPLLGKVIEKAETVTTETGLVADDRAPRRKRKRGKRRPIDVGALIDSEAAGALDWAKKAAGGDDTPAVAKVDTVLSAAPIIIPVTMPAGDNQAVERALETMRTVLEALAKPPPPRVIVRDRDVRHNEDGRIVRVIETETERSDVD